MLVLNKSSQTIYLASIAGSISPNTTAIVPWQSGKEDAVLIEQLLIGNLVLQTTPNIDWDSLDKPASVVAFNSTVSGTVTPPQNVFGGAWENGRVFLNSTNSSVTLDLNASIDGVTFYPMQDFQSLSTPSGGGSVSIAFPNDSINYQVVLTAPSGLTANAIVSFSFK